MRRLALGAAAAVAIAFGVVTVHGPFGPYPGGPLLGERVDAAVSDWTFADRRHEIQVETRLRGWLPYSVTTWCVTHDGRMYISADAGDSKLWVKSVLERPAARLRIAGRVYPVRFLLVTDEPAREFIWRLEAAKYEDIPLEPPASPPPAAGDAVRFEVVSSGA